MQFSAGATHPKLDQCKSVTCLWHWLTQKVMSLILIASSGCMFHGSIQAEPAYSSYLPLFGIIFVPFSHLTMFSVQIQPRCPILPAVECINELATMILQFTADQIAVNEGSLSAAQMFRVQGERHDGAQSPCKCQMDIHKKVIAVLLNIML